MKAIFAAAAALCAARIFFCRKLLRTLIKLVLSVGAFVLCSFAGIPIALNPITICIVFVLGVPGLLSLIAVYTLI